MPGSEQRFSLRADNPCKPSRRVGSRERPRSAFVNDFWPILVGDAMNHAGPDFTHQAMMRWITVRDGPLHLPI
jgi:hypothetical protein